VGIVDHGKMIAIGTQKELSELVGENETLRLHLPENVDMQPLVSALQELPEVIHASTVDSTVVLIVPEADDALPPVFGKADQLGFKIRSVDIQEPNLEAVFLKLTGRALRD
jgi:ABC-2 type transport system ATP-binding protein